MPKFRFRLEVSLRLAEQELDKKRRQLAKEIQTYEICVQEVEYRTVVLREGIEGQRQACITKPENLGMWQVYNQKKLEELELSREKLFTQEKSVEEARLKVIKAHREKEKYEKLKKKQAALFNLLEQRKEQVVLDEAGQSIFWRSLSKG